MATRVKSSQILDGTIVGSDLHSAVVVNTTGAGTFASLTANGGLTVDNFTLDGTTLALSSGDMTLDSAGDIILNADGADVILADGAVDFGRFKREFSNFVIKSETVNKDIIFRGSNTSGTVDALILDMSNDGKATFNDGINVDGNILMAGTITGVTSLSSVDATLTGTLKGPATFTIDPAVHGAISGTVVIAGDLQVDGTTTTINSTTMDVDDLNITVAKGAANAAAANGAGLTVDGASATLLYASTGDKFVFNKPLDVTGNIDATGNILVSGTVDGVDIAARDAVLTSTTTTAGAALPKAGGTLTGDLRLSDGVELELGDSAEFKIKHHASGYTHLENTVGTLYIDSDSVTFRDDDGSPTNLLVNQTGISVTGTIVATGNILPSQDVRLLDSKAARFGTDNDFSIYNDNSNTTLRNSTSNQDIIFLVNDDGAANTEVMRIDASTNRVGIGTNAPATKLHVMTATNGASTVGSASDELILENSTDCGLTIRSGSSSDGVISFADADDHNVGQVYYSHSSNSMTFRTNDSTAMTINSTGNVVIGTGTPVQTLDVNGSIGTRQVRHSVRPSLSLDFANSKELDSSITFYRDSIATYYDSKGTLKYANINEPRFDHDLATGESKGLLIEEARTNIFTYTNNPERWTLMSGSSSDPIANNIKSPDGTFNATSLIIDGSDPYFYQNNLTLNGTYTFSYWIKAVGTAIGKQYTTRITNVSSNSNIAGTLPSEWTRYTFTFTTGSTTTAYIGIEAPDSSPADGDEVSIWGAQLELGAFATSLIPSDTRFTSRSSVATYYDETGVLRTAPVNGARHGYKYDGRKWVETGLILEEAGTNMLYHSTKGSDLYGDVLAAEAIWTITDSSIDVSAPDGSTRTTKGVVGTSGNSWYWKVSPFSYTNGTTYTHSAWVRCAAGTTGTISMNVYPQTGATTITATDEWQRVSVRFAYNSSIANPYIGFVSPQTSRTFYFWGWQIEAHSGPTSYIKTLGSAVTRAADVASSVSYTRPQDIANINDISWYNAKESTIYGEGTSISGTSSVPGSPCLWGITDGTSTNRYLLRRHSSGGTASLSGYTFRLCDIDSNNDYFPVVTILPLWQDTEIHKMALSIKPNSQIAAADGIDAQMPSITTAEFDRPTMAQIGFAGSSSPWNGHIRKISYYPTQLNLAELKALTESN